MTKQEIKERIEACEKELAELRQKMDEPEYGGKRWRPKDGDKYYSLDCGGAIGPMHWYSDGLDAAVYRVGNVFRTVEEAEFAAERLRVIAELSDFAEGDEAVWDNVTPHYYLHDRPDKVGINLVVGTRIGMLFFPSLEAAKAAIEAVGEERVKKYYLRVMESE